MPCFKTLITTSCLQSWWRPAAASFINEGLLNKRTICSDQYVFFPSVLQGFKVKKDIQSSQRMNPFSPPLEIESGRLRISQEIPLNFSEMYLIFWKLNGEIVCRCFVFEGFRKAKWKPSPAFDQRLEEERRQPWMKSLSSLSFCLVWKNKMIYILLNRRNLFSF